jgi:ubiquinone/menaquinone biosynthesis C-methylase UbiE
MKLFENILYTLTKLYKSEWDNGHPYVKGDAGTSNHESAYAYFQFSNKIKYGLNIDVFDKKVVEIGCGHGGICVFASLIGAKQVIGVDLSDEALIAANTFKREIEDKVGRQLNTQFLKMTAENLNFEDNSIDVIIADNVFEHVENLLDVLNECNRVLVKGGKVIVPNFPSIKSKFGPHVKYGIKIPWVHILFSEKTIVKVMHRLSKTDEQMFDFYPGLKKNAKTFKEIRRYNDLNYITNKKFTNISISAGFKISEIYVKRPKFGWILMKMLPFLSTTALDDICSIGTSAILVKK